MTTFRRLVGRGVMSSAAAVALASAVSFARGSVAQVPDTGGAPVVAARVVRSFPHDRGAFTQGLEYEGGFLYEGTGLNGHSSIRKVRLDTGEVVQRRAVAAE